jgi:hypothetical protein
METLRHGLLPEEEAVALPLKRGMREDGHPKGWNSVLGSACA